MLRSLREVPKVVWLLAAGGFFNMIVTFTFVYLFVYLTDARGLSVAQAGLISGLGGAGLVAGNFTGGWFGDRFGHRRVLLTGSVLGGLACMSLSALPVALLYGVLPLAQYASGTVRAANSALVAVAVPEGERRQAFGVWRFAMNAGFTLGPPVGALLITQVSYGWLFVVDGLGTLAFAGYAARVLPSRGAGRTPGARDPGAPGVWAALRARPGVLVLLGAILVTDTVYRQLFSTLPVDLAAHGIGTGVYGWLLSINGGMILLLELPVAVGLRRRAPLRIIGSGLVLVGAGYGVLAAGVGLGTAVAMMVLLTGGEILYKTPATAYVADQAPPHVQGRFQSLYAGVSVSGVVLGPPLGGAVYEAAPGLLWPGCAVLAAGAGAALLWAAWGPLSVVGGRVGAVGAEGEGVFGTGGVTGGVTGEVQVKAQEEAQGEVRGKAQGTEAAG